MVTLGRPRRLNTVRTGNSLSRLLVSTVWVFSLRLLVGRKMKRIALVSLVLAMSAVVVFSSTVTRLLRL